MFSLRSNGLARACAPAPRRLSLRSFAARNRWRLLNAAWKPPKSQATNLPWPLPSIAFNCLQLP